MSEPREPLGAGDSCLVYVPDEALLLAVRMNQQQRRRAHAARQLGTDQWQGGKAAGEFVQTHAGWPSS